jgi:hypothetical protein
MNRENQQLRFETSLVSPGKFHVRAFANENSLLMRLIDVRNAEEIQSFVACINRLVPNTSVEHIQSLLLPYLSERDRTSKPKPSHKSIRPNLVCMKDVQPRPVSWLWQDRFALGRISLLVGQPGLGKSFLTCDMASRVSTGTPWPDGAPCLKGHVLLITAEDHEEDTIRPRLDAHRADNSRIHVLRGVLVKMAGQDSDKEYETVFSLADTLALEMALTEIQDVKLIIIDPIGSFLGSRTDAHRDNEVREVLAPLSKLSERYGASVVLVAHRRKGGNGSADESALGSRAFTGVARAVWHLSKDPDDPERRLFLSGKNNLAKQPDGLAFRIQSEPAFIHWEPESVSMTADDVFCREYSSNQPATSSALGHAIAWLKANLSTGARLAKQLKSEAAAAGIRERTLDRAAEAMGVIKEPEGFGKSWMWRMPSSDSPSGSQQSPSTKNGETADSAEKPKSDKSIQQNFPSTGLTGFRTYPEVNGDFPDFPS